MNDMERSHARLAHQGHADTPRELQEPAHAPQRQKVKHRKPKATAAIDQPWIVRAILGTHVPPLVVGAARGLLLTLLTIGGEILLTKVGYLKPSDWQIGPPVVVQGWFTLMGALDQWFKSGTNAVPSTSMR